MPKFDTVRFGELVYRDQDIVTLPDGLVGMPEQRNWLILDMGEGETMKWFQSLDRGDFGFPVTQPERVAGQLEATGFGSLGPDFSGIFSTKGSGY